MSWYNAISHNSDYYLKMVYVTEITNFLVNCTLINANHIFNHAIFKPFIIYRQLLLYSNGFAKLFLQKCFIREIHRKNSDKNSGIQVSDNFKITKLKCIKISRTTRKTAFKENKYYYIELNEMRRMIMILIKHSEIPSTLFM